MEEEDIDEILEKKIKFLMNLQRIPLQTCRLKLTAEPPGSITCEDVEMLFSKFWKVHSITAKENSFVIEFGNVHDAFIAKQTLHNYTDSQLNQTLKLDWIVESETDVLDSKLTAVLEYLPVLKEHNSEITPCEKVHILKYVSMFPIPIPENNFNILHKIHGVKGCNFRKIIEAVAKGVSSNVKPADILKVKIISKPLQIVISSRFLDKFQRAITLVNELLSTLYDEYRRYCFNTNKDPGVLHLKRRDMIRNRSKMLRNSRATEGNIYLTA